MSKINRIAMVVTMVLLAGLVGGAWMVDASAANTGKEINSPQAAVNAVAATLTVNTLEDELVTDGDCSLREALEAANTNLAVDGCGAGEAAAVDTITFEVEGTITVAEQLVITVGGPLVMDGGNEITISGGNATRVMWVDIGSTLTLQRLTIADGFTEGEDGAGLYNNLANITIQECQFLHNRIGESGSGGGIYSQDGNLTVVDSLFEGNGSSLPDTYGGGGYISGSQAEFVRTSFRNNESGGRHYSIVYCWPTLGCWPVKYSYPGGGGLYINEASVVIQESSFVANKGGDGGGGIVNGGSTTIVNSTFSNNTADGVDYSKGGGGILNEGTLTLINSTLSENHYSGDEGGGITDWDNAYIANSIITNNNPGDCAGSISDLGHNISSDDSCGFDIANSSLPNTDPLLGPLQDNGGLTETYALLDGSPAIDAGSPENYPETDQRGIPRPLDGNGDGQAVCDIGSFELVTGIAFYSLNQAASGDFGETLVYTLALYNFTGQTDTYSLALGSHAWETTLSTDQVGPLAPGTSETLTVAVTIPLEADWYQTDRVVVTAASISDAGEYSTSIQLTTQAYVPPQISVYPVSLESIQISGEIVTQTLTIRNNAGVDLTFNISDSSVGSVLNLLFDEPAGSTTFYDLSGYDNHATCLESTCPQAGIEGISASAVRFDGVDDSLTVPHNDEFDQIEDQDKLTIATWVNIEGWPRVWFPILDQYEADLDWGWKFEIIYNLGPAFWPAPGLLMACPYLFSLDEWYHVAISYDRELGYADFYVNGNQICHEAFAYDIPDTVGEPIYIGYSPGGEDAGALGSFDKLAVFNRALLAEEIRSLYLSGPSTYAPEWLAVDLRSGSLPAGTSLEVQVTFDATDLQPGSYSTALTVTSNDPLNPVIAVPVRMNVIFPFQYLPFTCKMQEN